eukprot:4012095-Amphidinium_carterae.1
MVVALLGIENNSAMRSISSISPNVGHTLSHTLTSMGRAGMPSAASGKLRTAAVGSAIQCPALTA